MDFQNMTVSDLRTEARKRGLTGATCLNYSKAELVEYLQSGKEKAPPNSSDLVNIIADAVSARLSSSVTEERVTEICAAYIAAHGTRTIVQTIDPERKIDVGLTHSDFPRLYKLIRIERNLWLHGDAGSGKSYLGNQLAQALELDYFPQSFCLQTTKSDLLGYTTVTGSYVETPLYRALTANNGDGGVFGADEIDNAPANVLNILNALLSQGDAIFPNGERLRAGRSFRMLCMANTIGTGANRRYIGRAAVDFATRNRFFFFKLETDWALVREITGDNKLVDWLLSIKEKIKQLNLDCIDVTARTAYKAAPLHAAGFTHGEILDGLILQGCAEETAAKFEEFR